MLLYTHISGQCDAEPVVLIHGLFGSYENLGVIERSLNDQFKVINVDARNHGRSAHHEDMSYELMAEDLAQTLDSLHIDKATIIGHSMGGKIAMTFAMTYPSRVNKLVVADIAPVSYQPRHNSIFKGLNAVASSNISSRSEADTLLQEHIKEMGVRQFLLKSLVKEDDVFMWRFNLQALIKNYSLIIGAPKTAKPFIGPVLFIKGSESDYILPEHKNDITALFPKAQAKIIQGTGHWLHAEKPAIFTRLVKEFLLS